MVYNSLDSFLPTFNWHNFTLSYWFDHLLYYRLVRCWRGYLSGARCRFAYAQLMPLPLTVSCSRKFRLVLPFWYRLTREVPDTVQGAIKVVVVVVL